MTQAATRTGTGTGTGTGWGRWRTRVEIGLWRHGWAWLLIAGLLLAVAAVWWLAWLPAQVALGDAQGQLAAARAGTPGAVSPPVASTEHEQLRRTRAALQGHGNVTQRLQAMAAIAQAQGVALPQADYQQQTHAGTQLLQVTVLQPVRATYPQLRRYVEAVLRDMPDAALEQVTARRESVGQAELEVRLRWSLWLAGAAP